MVFEQLRDILLAEVMTSQLRFAYKAHSQRGFDFEVLVHILPFF